MPTPASSQSNVVTRHSSQLLCGLHAAYLLALLLVHPQMACTTYKSPRFRTDMQELVLLEREQEVLEREQTVGTLRERVSPQ